MKEVRVYIVDKYNYEFDTSPVEWEDNKFINEAEIQGSVYSLYGFTKEFNSNDTLSSNCIIRII